MTIILLLIISSVVVAALFLGAFIWSTTSGQYDDLHTPAVRMLLPERTLRITDLSNGVIGNRPVRTESIEAIQISPLVQTNEHRADYT